MATAEAESTPGWSTPNDDPHRLPACPGERGVLTVTDRAVAHLVEGIIGDSPLGVDDVDVDVDEIDDNGVTVRVRVAMAYPNGALADTLRTLRRHIAVGVAWLLGRPLRRLDVTVTNLYIPQRGPARVR